MSDHGFGAVPPPPPTPVQTKPKRWPWILGMVVTLFVGIAIGAAATPERAQPLAKPTETATATEAPVPRPSPTEVGENSLTNPFPPGTTGLYEGWRVKVVGFNPDASDEVERANSFNTPPRKGTYAIVTLQFTRTGGGSANVWLGSEASLVVRGDAYPESQEACCLPDDWSDIGTIPEGGSATGTIPFDVPKGGLDSAVLYMLIDDTEGFFKVSS